ncbi:MAG: MbnP family protein [Bacteroidota bacterium]|nr:MbnP family protein [Bacteroidota bacterium]
MRNSLLVILFATLFLLGGCDLIEKEITVEFQLIQGGNPYEKSTSFNKGDTAIALDLFHFYISELYLGEQMLSEVLFVNPCDSLYSNYTLSVDKSEDAFSFGLGVPSQLNNMDPTAFETSHPLSSAFAMYWTWASKYRFLKVEGRFNDSGDLSNAGSNSALIWHTGTDNLYRIVTFNEQIQPGDHLVIKLDLDQLIDSISLQNNAFTHTTVSSYATAELVSDQIVSAFSITVK